MDLPVFGRCVEALSIPFPLSVEDEKTRIELSRPSSPRFSTAGNLKQMNGHQETLALQLDDESY